MADQAQAISVVELAEKLAAVEKKLAELQAKYEGSPLTAADTEKKNKPGSKPNAEVEEEGPDPRIKVIVSRRNPETGEPIEEAGKLKSLKNYNEKDRAFILRKNVYPAKLSYFTVEDSSEIEILNPSLWTLLKRYLGDYPYHTFRESPVTLNSPYQAIVFNFDKLKSVAEETPKDDDDKLAREDLGRLLGAISGGASGDQKLDKYFKIRPSYGLSQTTTFQDLWTVFPPGTLVYGRPFQNEHQVFVVKDNVRTWPDKDQQRSGGRDYLPWKLEAWSYDWRDGTFRRTDYTLLFEHFDGHLPLDMLPYYPFDLPRDSKDSFKELRKEEIKKELIERGRKFRRYCEAKEGERLFEYQGKAVFEKTGFSNFKQDEEGGEKSHSSLSPSDFFAFLVGRRGSSGVVPTVKSTQVQSRVMVDYDSYFQYGQTEGRNGALEPGNSGSGCGCSDCQANEGLKKNYRTRFDLQSSVKAKEWEEEQYMLCPPRVLGYILQEKQWAQLQVTSLSEISNETTEESALNQRLKLADDLTPDNSSDGQGDGLEIDDIIPGKGKGLVMLLYGPPGVGKTSTAEAIAIETRKPLFSVSVADVGTRAKHVESNLSRIFSLATKWQAILLLEKRIGLRFVPEDLTSYERHHFARPLTIFEVFLRVLEYYHGIMILTTNQIANFDVAIPSRIHVAIKYESLKKGQMQAIFEEFLNRLDENNAIDDYDDIREWLETDVYREAGREGHGLDGRQIRNLVTTALGLARAERMEGGNHKLRVDHMRRAFNIVSDFKRDFSTQMQRYMDSQDKMIK
ncbi:hypothetical protein Daus18300_011254 [Diaporthe australafricana]|uniref:AAA+ ATPase domain-containing protein n=1 Tax=Diaporthe australafricana TaxID=127596 RepID=A0ABR3W791_9PEZI